MMWTAGHFSPDDLEAIRTAQGFRHSHVALRMRMDLIHWDYVSAGTEQWCRDLPWPTDCGPLTVVEIRRVLSDIDRPGAP